jgi:glycosyltransferase involved in cell wall biosynthesis
METPSLSIIVPAYNEAENIPKVIPILANFCSSYEFELIVVNDGSSDDSLQLLTSLQKEHRFIIHHNKVNKGYGGAIKEGIKKASGEFVITVDADGQHQTEDILHLLSKQMKSDADMVVGRRPANSSSIYRTIGKTIIKKILHVLMPIPVKDLNSGMKLYNKQLALAYLPFCPNSMAYSDVITLMFIHNRTLVVEEDIQIANRLHGKSTISTKTAFVTIYELLNTIMLFNPIRIFFPVSVFFFLIGLIWGLPIMLSGLGISVGALLFFILSINFFLIGLLAEQTSQMRKYALTKN